jgi:hypothetical protein
VDGTAKATGHPLCGGRAVVHKVRVVHEVHAFQNPGTAPPLIVRTMVETPPTAVSTRMRAMKK